jgi:hypothetical protein
MILSSARYEVHDRCPRRYALERTHEPRSISGLGVVISAALLDTFDRCERRFALERNYESRGISTVGLLYRGVEGGVVALDPGEGAKDAVRAVTAVKDVDAGPLAAISAVRHVGLMSEVISLALRRKLGPMSRLQDVEFGKHQWHSGLFETRSAILHRFVLVSHIDDDVLRGFAHSWGTVGELAALGRDVTLTFIAIGAQRGGRRHGAWSKCFQHPVQKTMLRFGRRKGSNGFTDGWKEIWREQTDITAARWLDQMQADDVLGDLIQSRTVPYRKDDARIAQAKADLVTILPAMEAASVDSPMRRSSCDDPIRGVCPFSPLCWSPVEVEIDDLLHLYRQSMSP